MSSSSDNDGPNDGPSVMSALKAPFQSFAQTLHLQSKTREKNNFLDTEATLPMGVQHSHFQRAKDVGIKVAATSTVTDVLSYLGSNNPLPQDIKSDDTVWLMDNVAFKSQDKDEWQAEFVVAVFEQHESKSISDAVNGVAEKIGLANDDAAKKTIESRMHAFLQDILPGRTVGAMFGGNTPLSLGPGGHNGISSDIRLLPTAEDGTRVQTVAQVPQGVTGMKTMTTVYAEPEGWAVISDIDDSIKVTMTSDPIGILRSTFVSDPTPIAGMPELYAWIQQLISERSPFFYLSASPYNLYPFLHAFREAHYPQGQIVLRDASWMSIPGLLSNLTLGTHEYKVDRIRKINSWLPRRKLICIGDSTQSDPESYGDT
jgi:phosphatidate phosphatase APP1